MVVLVVVVGGVVPPTCAAALFRVAVPMLVPVAMVMVVIVVVVFVVMRRLIQEMRLHVLLYPAGAVGKGRELQSSFMAKRQQRSNRTARARQGLEGEWWKLQVMGLPICSTPLASELLLPGCRFIYHRKGQRSLPVSPFQIKASNPKDVVHVHLRVRSRLHTCHGVHSLQITGKSRKQLSYTAW